MNQPQPSPNEPAAPVVNPPDNSRLDQLAAEYALMQPQAQAATERLEEIKTAIKAELQREQPGMAEVWLTSPHLTKTLRMKYVPPGWTLDAKAMKVGDPETYVKWAKERRPYWELKAV